MENECSEDCSAEYDHSFQYEHDGYAPNRRGRRKKTFGAWWNDEGQMIVVMILLIGLVPAWWGIDKGYFSHSSKDYPLKYSAIVVSKDSYIDDDGDRHTQLAIQSVVTGKRYLISLDNRNLWGILKDNDTIKIGFDSSGHVENVGFQDQTDCLGCQSNMWN